MIIAKRSMRSPSIRILYRRQSEHFTGHPLINVGCYDTLSLSLIYNIIRIHRRKNHILFFCTSTWNVKRIQMIWFLKTSHNLSHYRCIVLGKKQNAIHLNVKNGNVVSKSETVQSINQLIDWMNEKMCALNLCTL